MASLKKVLSTPIPVPFKSMTGGKIVVDTVLIEPRVIIMIASELLAILAGEGGDPKDTSKKKNVSPKK